MRILHVIPYFYPTLSYGGPPIGVYELSRQLVRLGHEVCVFTTDAFDQKRRIQGKRGKFKEIEREIDGIKVIYFRNVSNRLAFDHKFFYSPGLKRYLKGLSANFDLIHLHEYRTLLNISLSSYAKRKDIPYILTAYGSLPAFMSKRWLKKIYNWLFGFRLLSSAYRLIALSQSEERQLLSMGVNQDKIEVIGLGIDLKAFATLLSAGSFKNKYGLKNKEVILFLGRLNRIKGLDFLLKSFNLLSKKLKNVFLVIAGPDDGYGAEVKRLIENMNLKKRTLIIGALGGEEKLSALRDADLFVYPSVYEIFGVVPLEALMCGTPVILSWACGCGEILAEGGAAILVDYGDIQSLTKAMEDILKNKEKQAHMVKQGQKIIRQRLTWEYLAEKTLTLYQDVLNTKSS